MLLVGYLGLRVSEIMALKWTDFDFEELTLLGLAFLLIRLSLGR